MSEVREHAERPSDRTADLGLCGADNRLCDRVSRPLKKAGLGARGGISNFLTPEGVWELLGAVFPLGLGLGKQGGAYLGGLSLDHG